MPSVAFYISGHGFGHASRQIEIINALGSRLPEGFEVVVRSSAAEWLFTRTLKTPVTFLKGKTDTGIVQIDSLRLDATATARAAAAFYGGFAERAASDAALLRAHDVRLVIADAPPLACAAAAAAGVPAIVIANFTWDWIYEGYEDQFREFGPDVLPLIREAYAAAAAGWRLPMHGGFGTFRSVTDLPFVARHATRTRQEVLKALDLPRSRPLALSSFGGYGLEGFAPEALDCLESWTVIFTGRTAPPSLLAGIAFVEEARMYAAGLRYEDLVAAVEVVVTKPGYGIISECVANDTGVLYTSRGRFPEYDVMVSEMPRVLRCAYLEQEALLAGRWKAGLDSVLASPAPPERPRTDGAELAATEILAALVG